MLQMEAILLSFSLMMLFLHGILVESQLSTSFYASSCPAVGEVVRLIVESHFGDDPTIAPGLLRLHFHDCFVQVCHYTFYFSDNSCNMSFTVFLV